MGYMQNDTMTVQIGISKKQPNYMYRDDTTVVGSNPEKCHRNLPGCRKPKRTKVIRGLFLHKHKQEALGSILF